MSWGFSFCKSLFEAPHSADAGIPLHPETPPLSLAKERQWNNGRHGGRNALGCQQRVLCSHWMQRGFARHSVPGLWEAQHHKQGHAAPPVLGAAAELCVGQSAAFQRTSIFSLLDHKTCGHYHPVFPTDVLLRWHLLLLEGALGQLK